MVISDGIPVVPRNRKSRDSVPNPSTEEKITWNSVPWNKIGANSHNSVPIPSTEENTTRNSVPWNQNRCKFLEFRSEPFRGRGHNSEFLSVQQKIVINSRNAVPNLFAPWKRNQHHFVNLFFCCFVKLIFSADFHSVPFRSELRNWLFRGTRNTSE
jgi:hypothetical protein